MRWLASSEEEIEPCCQETVQRQREPYLIKAYNYNDTQGRLPISISGSGFAFTFHAGSTEKSMIPLYNSGTAHL